MAGSNIYTGSNGVGAWWQSSDPTSELGQEGDNGWWNTDSGRYQAVEEARKRAQEESDREYNLRVKQLKQQAAQIAISKGQAEATAWYNRQMVQLTKDKLAEEQRQFNVTSSGYQENGNPTLEREKYQNQALYDWTKEAVDLASTPEDWVKYKRYTSGVSANQGSIPGLSWTTGGQQGSQTFNGQQQSNSLSNVLTAMGIATGSTSTGDSMGAATTGTTATGTGDSANWAQQAVNQSSGDTTGATAAATGTTGTTGTGTTQAQTDTSNMTADEQQIYGLANEFSRNPQGAQFGWWERLDPTTQKLISGAAKAQGHDWQSVLSRYNQSRWMAGSS